MLNRLHLAFPLLRDLFRYLQENPEELKRVPASSESETTQRCFQLAETVQYLLDNTLPVTVSELGARFFDNSKALRQGEYRSPAASLAQDLRARCRAQ